MPAPIYIENDKVESIQQLKMKQDHQHEHVVFEKAHLSLMHEHDYFSTRML
ncbi:hypothetical protein HDV06_005735 [Boothiomyces sp. JEL0866]|nr:hypothetical protein HDV06_005735 [Boothiomyces sp. JEL0866]